MITEFIRNRSEHLSFNSLVVSERIGLVKEKMTKRLSLHETLYYSPLCPGYLHLFNNVSELNQFKSIQVRDGALGVHRFFFENPAPNGCKTKMLVHSSLSRLVPASWIDQINFYEHYFEPPTVKQNPNKMLLIITIDKLHCTLEEVNSFKSLLNGDVNLPQKVECLVLDSDNRDYDEAHFTGHSFNFIRSLSNAFQDLKINEVSFVNWSTVMNISTINEYMYYDFNDNNYLYADSYILHFMFTRGATPLRTVKNRNIRDESSFQLSKFHGIQLMDGHKKHWEKENVEISNFLNMAYQKMLPTTELYFDASDKNPPFCTKSFEELTDYIIKTELNDLI